MGDDGDVGDVGDVKSGSPVRAHVVHCSIITSLLLPLQSLLFVRCFLTIMSSRFTIDPPSQPMICVLCTLFLVFSCVWFLFLVEGGQFLFSDLGVDSPIDPQTRFQGRKNNHTASKSKRERSNSVSHSFTTTSNNKMITENDILFAFGIGAALFMAIFIGANDVANGTFVSLYIHIMYTTTLVYIMCHVIVMLYLCEKNRIDTLTH